MAFSSNIFANWSRWSLEDDNFLLNQPLDFSNFLITTSSPNFSFNTWLASPISSTRPKSLALLPDQNSPENNSTSVFFSFIPRLVSTTFMKSLCRSSWIFLSLSISSFFSSRKGSKVLLFFPAVWTLLSTPIFFINSVKPKEEYITPIEPIIELEFAYISSPAHAIK